MVEYDDVTLEPLPNVDVESGRLKRHILVIHDELTFNANDDLKRG